MSDASPASAPKAEAVLGYLAERLVDDPERVEVDATHSRSGVKLSLRVGADDMGKVIGRRGRIAQAIRGVVRAAGAADGVDVTVDIVD